MDAPQNPDLDFSGLPPLAHERLDVYQFAKELDQLVVAISRRVGRGHAYLVDQLQRASISASLNLVEANGRQGADRLQHLRISKGSFLEIDGALTLLDHRGLVKPAERTRARELTTRIAQMLSGLMRQ